jgi:glutamate:GABA antiporter
MGETADPPARDSGLITSLGLWDVVAMNIVAVVGLRWIARSARVGAPSVTLWTLAGTIFFLPLASVLAELSSRDPAQGGVYVWTRRAFGPLHGFICGWCLWVNNLFYFPSLLLFGAANAAWLVSGPFPALGESRLYAVLFVLGWLWLTTGLNVVGLSKGKWLQNVGGLATWIPAMLLIACGAAAFVLFGSATSFAPGALVPRDEFWGTLSLWSAMCFAFSGFEISSMVGQEVRDPRRTIPRGIAWSGVAITGVYILGSSSILVAVPAAELSELSGITDAVDAVTGRLGLAGLGALTGLLLAVGAIGGTSSWVAGAARVPFAVGVDRSLPAAFGRLHPRFRTPHVALVVQAAAASLLFLGAVFITLGGEDTSIQEAYDILVNLTILLYFVPYLYLFAAFVRLRRMDDASRAPEASDVRVPGGWMGAWAVAASGFFATAIAMGLVFVPPAGTTSVLSYEANLVGQAGAVIGVGLCFYWWSRQGREGTAHS